MMRLTLSTRYYAMRIKNSVTFAGALLLGITALRAADWPQWQGPDRTRVSREIGLMKQWPAGGPTVVWTANGLGGGYGSMAVAGDRVFVQSARSRNSAIIALNRAYWKAGCSKALGGAQSADRCTGPRCRPTADRE